MHQIAFPATVFGLTHLNLCNEGSSKTYLTLFTL